LTVFRVALEPRTVKRHRQAPSQKPSSATPKTVKRHTLSATCQAPAVKRHPPGPSNTTREAPPPRKKTKTNTKVKETKGRTVKN
jgi:hypothetical protein